MVAGRLVVLVELGGLGRYALVGFTLADVAGQVVHALEQPCPTVRVLGLFARLDVVVHPLPQLLVRQRLPRDPEHGKLVGQQTTASQVEECRYQLPFGEVAGCPEDDHQARRHCRRLRILLNRTLGRSVAREAVAFLEMHVLTVTDLGAGS